MFGFKKLTEEEQAQIEKERRIEFLNKKVQELMQQREVLLQKQAGYKAELNQLESK